MNRIEQHHDPLMRVVAGAVVTGEDAHDFEPETPRLEITGHETEHAEPIWLPHRRAQRQDRFTAAGRDQGIRHDRNARLHRQEPLDIVVRQHEHTHGVTAAHTPIGCFMVT